MFFYPAKEQLVDPDKLGIVYEVKKIDDGMGPVLNAWFLPAKGEVKGTILHLHGNAENISTHVGSVYWLPKYGYNVFTFDYRGYGASEGSPSIDGVQEDALRAAKFLLNQPGIKEKPVFLFGQSIGASIALHLASRPEIKPVFTAVIAESPFSSYRTIVRDKLRDLWLTYLFNYPLSIFISTKFDPIRSVSFISPVPLLLVHPTNDSIIPIYHSKELFAAASQPKEFWEIPKGDHIQTFQSSVNQNKLLTYLDKHL
jgi:fermentation-respiration switch protein FrsA (DUF1100 family)